MPTIDKETVRYFIEEQELVVDYSGGDPGGAWSNLVTFNNVFSITHPSLLVFQAGFTADATGEGGTRISIRDTSGAVYYIGGFVTDVEGDHVFYGICYMPYGASELGTQLWDIFYEGRECAADISDAWLKVGITNFSDLTGDQLNRVLNTTINAGVETTLVDEDIVGTPRVCALGSLRKHVIRLQ